MMSITVLIALRDCHQDSRGLLDVESIIDILRRPRIAIRLKCLSLLFAYGVSWLLFRNREHLLRVFKVFVKCIFCYVIPL